jgi:hypothetical protein
VAEFSKRPWTDFPVPNTKRRRKRRDREVFALEIFEVSHPDLSWYSHPRGPKGAEVSKGKGQKENTALQQTETADERQG